MCALIGGRSLSTPLRNLVITVDVDLVVAVAVDVDGDGDVSRVVTSFRMDSIS
jgi:hypothetical protein